MAVSVWFVVVPPAATHIVNMPDPDPGTLTESPDRSLTVAADELGMPVTVPLTVAWLPMLHVDAASGNGWYAAARRAMPEKAGTEARLLLPLTVIVTHACPVWQSLPVKAPWVSRPADWETATQIGLPLVPGV